MSKIISLIGNQYYHIYNRGNNGNNLFFEDNNYHYFYDLYIHHIHPFANTYAYCFMKNHFHLLIRIKPPKELSNLSTSDCSQAFSNLFNAYTKSINKQYNKHGSLFQKPFKRILVNSHEYYIHLINYIHRNPEKHQFTQDFRTYAYSSYTSISQQRKSIIDNPQVIKWFGSLNAFKQYHQQFDDTKIKHLIQDD